MDDYVETTADNGGVHLNSGIPNKAFQLAAVAIGGTSISGAGRIWYDALVINDVPSGSHLRHLRGGDRRSRRRPRRRRPGRVGPGRCRDRRRGGGDRPEIAAPVATSPQPSGWLRVERSGGFAGRTETAEVDLGQVDDPTSGTW